MTVCWSEVQLWHCTDLDLNQLYQLALCHLVTLLSASVSASVKWEEMIAGILEHC